MEKIMFYDHETKRISGRVRQKARRFVSRVFKGNGFWKVQPIPGYNTRTYTVEKHLWGWSCNCQAGSQGKLCSHTLAVWMKEKINGAEMLRRKEAVK